MVDIIVNFIKNEYWATVIMSIVPLIELKGGIVFARGAGLSFLQAFGLAYVGSTAVFFPIFFLLVPILNLLKKTKWFKSFAEKCENYIRSKADGAVKNNEKKGKKRSETFLKQAGVFIFVAIPLPMTGVWMGTAVAVFLGLEFKDAVLSVILGNAVAGLIISALAELCAAVWTIKSLDYILYGLFALAVILLAVTVIKVSKSRKTEEPEDTDGQKGN